MARFDDRAREPGDADSVGAHLHRDLGAVRVRHRGAHRLGVLGAEVEDVADLDPAPLVERVLRHRAGAGVVLVVGGGVEPGPLVHDRLQVRLVVDPQRQRVRVEPGAVAVDGALAGIREHDELVAVVAADGPALRLHRDRREAEPGEGAQVGDEHLVVGAHGAGVVDIEGVVVLHVELAATHDAEARAQLVPKLPLNLIEVLRQVAVAAHGLAEDVGHDLFVGGAEEHRAVVAVRDAQHLPAVVLVAAALLPQLGRLDRRHEDLLAAGGVHLLAHHLLDLAQHAMAQRQPAVNAGARLPDHAGAQHEPVRRDLRLGRVLSQGRQEVT